jgi:aromatic ring-opening dioxygenase catalytic subunit (LigB family)
MGNLPPAYGCINLAQQTPQTTCLDLQDFDVWLRHIITSADVPALEREAALIKWEAAPSARYSHPREEHLLPLHVATAAANYVPGRLTGNDVSDGFAVSSFRFD